MTSIEALKAMIGEYVVAHSAPTAWIGRLTAVTVEPQNIWITLEEACLWLNGEPEDIFGVGGGPPANPAHPVTLQKAHPDTAVLFLTAIKPLRWVNRFDWSAPRDQA